MSVIKTSVVSGIIVSTGGPMSATVMLLAMAVFLHWVLQSDPRTARAVSIIRALRRPGRRP